MRVRIAALLLLALPGLTGCGGAGALLAGEPVSEAPRRFQGAERGTVGQGTWNGEVSLATRPTFLVARTPAEWQAVWDLIGQPYPGNLPEDLMALAIFIGTRTTGGYSVSIANVQLERRADYRDRLLVEYVEEEPGRDARTAQMLTSPYTVVLVQRIDSNVRFAKVEDRRLYD